MIKKDIKQKMQNPIPNVSFTFSESILKLFNDSDTFNLTIANGHLKGANGSTKGASITISNDYLKKATDLSIARTMIHETVHAYLNVRYTQVLSFEDGFDFKLKMEKFAIDNGIANINSNKFHHEFMGQYVDAMAASLLIWDEKYGSKTNLGWEYYRSMAFGGLLVERMDANGNLILDKDGNKIYDDTNSFKALVPKESDRDKIKNILENEQNGNSKSKGKKCK